MKSTRHALIKDIIEAQVVETQEDLAEALRNNNIKVTRFLYISSKFYVCSEHESM